MMEIRGRTRLVTGRCTRLTLTAETFEEERILGIILKGLTQRHTKFEISCRGEPLGGFEFGGGRPNRGGPA